MSKKHFEVAIPKSETLGLNCNIPAGYVRLSSILGSLPVYKDDAAAKKAGLVNCQIYINEEGNIVAYGKKTASPAKDKLLLGASNFYVSAGSSDFPQTIASPQEYGIAASFISGLPSVKLASTWASTDWGSNTSTATINTASGSTAVITEEDLGAGITVPFDIPVGSIINLSWNIAAIRAGVAANTLGACSAIMRLPKANVMQAAACDSTIVMLESISDKAPDISCSSDDKFYFNFTLSHTVTEKVEEGDVLLLGLAMNNLNALQNTSLQCSWNMSVEL